VTEGGTRRHGWDWGPLFAVVLLVFFLGYSSYAGRREIHDSAIEGCRNAQVRTEAAIRLALAQYVKDETMASDVTAPQVVRSASRGAADADLAAVKQLNATRVDCKTRWPDPPLVDNPF
jgi:hypothetical protein